MRDLQLDLFLSFRRHSGKFTLGELQHLLHLRLSRAKTEIITQFRHEYVVKRWLFAKRQNWQFVVFAQNYAVFVSEFVRMLCAT